MHKAPAVTAGRRLKKQGAAKIFRDNPFLDRLIEVGTKALRRELMSGETLRAPRQQLRRLRASVFDLLIKSPTIARLFGARRFLGPFRDSVRFPIIRKSVQMIRKNLTGLCSLEHRGYSGAAFYFSGESLVA